MTHGISYGYDHFTSPEIFWQHLEYVKHREDKIWVGTFEEVAAYIKERDAMQLDIVQDKKGLLISTRLLLDSSIYKERLTLALANRK